RWMLTWSVRRWRHTNAAITRHQDRFVPERNTKVPKPISAKIGSFGLPREVMLQLEARIHHEIAESYDTHRLARSALNDRLYYHRMVVQGDPEKHLFTLAIDDSTSQDDLIIEGIS